MKCEICRSNDAVIKLVEIINDEKFEMNLCMECAKKKGLNNPEANLKMIIEDAISMLENRRTRKRNTIEKKRLSCPFCLTTLSEFKRKGKLGCKHCYTIFWSEVVSVFNSYQGLDTNELPTIIAETQEEKIKRLQKELKQVVKSEEYEKAAIIRDKLDKLISSAHY